MRAFALVATVVTLGAQPLEAAPRATGKSCEAELGARRAAELRSQCRRVAARPGACRTEPGCDALRSEIRRGCEEARGDAPGFCEFYVERDREEDE